MLNLDLQKDLIIKRFKKSIESYDQNAFIQKDIVSILVKILIENIDLGKVKKIFEIGAGTGILTKSLIKNILNSDLDYYINDLISDYKIIYEKINYKFKDHVMGDIEKIDYPKNLDLVISSSTFQWIENKEHVLDKIYDSMNENGYLLISSFSLDNLKEIRAITGLGLNYLSKIDADKYISKKFDILYSEERIMELLFDDPVQILFHIKSTGVNSLKNIFWRKSDLENFCNSYKNLYSMKNGKIPLTYNPTFYLAKKK